MAENRTNQIPEVVIQRLPVYARALEDLEQKEIEVINSQALGDLLRVTPAQIRKDLSYFGRFGKQGRGYNVSNLLRQLHTILGLDREWPMAIVGMGQLGSAVVEYGGFAPQKFRVVAAFDHDPARIGAKVGEITIQPMEELAETLREKNITIGIVTVPRRAAQEVVDALVSAGVEAILNYAPYAPQVPGSVRVREVDPVLVLQSMTFHLKNSQGTSLR